MHRTAPSTSNGIKTAPVSPRNLLNRALTTTVRWLSAGTVTATLVLVPVTARAAETDSASTWAVAGEPRGLSALVTPGDLVPSASGAGAAPSSLAMLPLPLAPMPSVPAESLLERGIASTYGTGDGFQGNRTACGQMFDTYVAQVAHKTLPCGTTVRVLDRDTGKSVTAKVTDRGPYIAGRVVDLSWAAFRELDPTGPGLLNVEVYVVGQ